MRNALAVLAMFVLFAPAAQAVTMQVSFSGGDGGGSTASASFVYDSTLALTQVEPTAWSATFQGPATVDGVFVPNAFLFVGIGDGETSCDSGAASCDYFFFDIYLDSDDASGPSGLLDTNNDSLWIVDFELPAGTVTPGVLPDFTVLPGDIQSYVADFATVGTATVDIDEWVGPDFSTGATGSITPVPEPSTGLLSAFGLLLLAMRRPRS